MSLEREYLDLMPSTVLVSTSTAYTAYGSPAWSTVTRRYRARITFSASETRDSNGNRVTANSVLWMASTGTIRPTDRVTLPDGSTPPIIRVERVTDEIGVHHTKVYLG